MTIAPPLPNRSLRAPSTLLVLPLLMISSALSGCAGLWHSTPSPLISTFVSGDAAHLAILTLRQSAPTPQTQAQTELGPGPVTGAINLWTMIPPAPAPTSLAQVAPNAASNAASGTNGTTTAPSVTHTQIAVSGTVQTGHLVLTWGTQRAPTHRAAIEAQRLRFPINLLAGVASREWVSWTTRDVSVLEQVFPLAMRVRRLVTYVVELHRLVAPQLSVWETGDSASVQHAEAMVSLLREDVANEQAAAAGGCPAASSGVTSAMQAFQLDDIPAYLSPPLADAASLEATGLPAAMNAASAAIRAVVAVMTPKHLASLGFTAQGRAALASLPWVPTTATIAHEQQYIAAIDRQHAAFTAAVARDRTTLNQLASQEAALRTQAQTIEQSLAC